MRTSSVATEIEEFNTIQNCCNQQFCDKRAEFFVKTHINDIPLIIILCKKHAKEWNLVADKEMIEMK